MGILYHVVAGRHNERVDEHGPDPNADVVTALTLPENSAGGVNVGAPIAATDLDGHTLTYSLHDPDSGSFEIDSETGQLKTRNGVIYDYETKSRYELFVLVEDIFYADGISVTVTLTDVAE